MRLGEVSGLTHNQSTRFQRGWQVRRRLQPPSVGVLVQNEIFKEIWAEVERLDQGISAPAPRRGDTFGDLIGKRADKPPHGARSTSQAGS